MSDAVLRIDPLGFQWPTIDPFLFCVHHDDAYPRGTEAMAPAASLAGRDLGQDFEPRDGWRMYHGTEVPGFPAHPHRGFETVTIVRRGLIDHSDSLGATARFGGGDVQWLTAGRGIVHCEMFPLVHTEAPNPLELFQIWLNLPAAGKMCAPHFSMLWRDGIPTVAHRAPNGAATRVTLIAGHLGDTAAPAPPPDSWAANPDADVAIWTIAMEPGASWTLPAASPTSQRMLYAFAGDGLQLDGRAIPRRSGVRVKPDEPLALATGAHACELLVLQGRPIAEPVVSYGPFVMSSRLEIQQAIADYQRTQFGGWPWPSPAPVHPRAAGRFARRPGGQDERPNGK